MRQPHQDLRRHHRRGDAHRARDRQLGKPDQVEMSHLPNEFIAIEDLDKCTEIYIRALSNLPTRENKG